MTARPHRARRRFHRVAPALVVVLLSVGVIIPSSAGAVQRDIANTADAQQPPRDVVVYVPIEAPVIEDASAVAAAGGSGIGANRASTSTSTTRSTAAQATQAIATSFNTAANVPLVKVPGTAIPLWWLLLVLLAVPLARAWRSWTARMFV